MNPALGALLAPRSVAVVGASPRRRLGRGVVANLQRFGFRGSVYPVHPNAEAVAGLPAFPNIAALPEVPDCAVIALSPENTLAAFREAVAAGVRAAVILGSGFAEAGEPGRQIQAEIASLARDAGVALCGPNCLGLVSPAAGVTLTGYHLPADLAPGPVAGVSQSGSVFFSLLHNTRGIRFHTMVSTGNEAVLTAIDYLDVALEQPATRLLVAFLESIGDGERFLSLAAQARARRVPLVVLKVGRSAAGQAAVVAHTGALAGADAIFGDVCRQAGIIRVETLDELYDTAEFLLGGRLPAGDRVGAVTDSGGEKTLILDWGERLGLRFPEPSAPSTLALRGLLTPDVPVANPLDAWGGGNYDEVYPAALRVLAADEGIDTVVLGTDLTLDTEEAVLYGQAMLELHAATRKPVALVVNQATGIDSTVATRLRDRGIPVLQGTEYGYRAIRHAVDYAQALARPTCFPQPRDEDVAWLRGELARVPRIVGEAPAKRLLARFGVPVTREELVATPDAAREAAARIGYPVALKAQGPGLAHKSDAGALALNLATPAALEAAWAAIGARVADIEGMLVQEMVTPGLELLIGMTRDITFGPVISVGLGGVFVELLDDVVNARPPLGDEEARRLLLRLRGARLFTGYRGMRPRDLGAAARAVAAVARLVAAAGDWLVELDVNPLIVGAEGEGARAVDALIVTREA